MNQSKHYGIGTVTLRVRDQRSEVTFYNEELGLIPKEEDGSTFLFAREGSSPLLVLKNDPNAKAPAKYSAGLYHFGILLPDRSSLASTYLALGNKGTYFEGFANHLVSEALYLRDPEGNGIEIYRDIPSSEWSHNPMGDIKMDTLPLDLDSMILELSKSHPELKENPVPFPLSAKIGHVHLKVSDLAESKKFYHEKLGMGITADHFSGACFLSYGGYHHHVGLNTWESMGGPKKAEGEIGLEEFAIEISDVDLFRNIVNSLGGNVKASNVTLRDPNGVDVRLHFSNSA